jgi:hypothetical protein
MIVFTVMWLCYLIAKKEFIPVIKIALITFLFFLPWPLRNYIVFKKIIPLTTSSGINLYRGHNEDGIEAGDGASTFILTQLICAEMTILKSAFPPSMLI